VSEPGKRKSQGVQPVACCNFHQGQAYMPQCDNRFNRHLSRGNMRLRKAAASVIAIAMLAIHLILAMNTRLIAQTNGRETLSQEQKLWGLMQVWSSAKYNFVYFDRVPDLDWDAEVQAAIPRIISANTTDDYYLILRELAAKLNDGHAMIMPPGAMNGQSDFPPVEFQMIENKIILARVGDNEESQIITHNLDKS
jgi:hypothetical protein